MIAKLTLKPMYSEQPIITKYIDWETKVQICYKNNTSQKEYICLKTISLYEHYIVIDDVIYKIDSIISKEIF
jgi:hypothetical protein